MTTSSGAAPEPESKQTDTGARSKAFSPSVRLLVALAVCCGAVYWAYLEVWKSQNPVLAAARGLRAKDPAARIAAISEVANLGLKDPTATIAPLLETLSKDADAKVRARAAQALAVMSSYAIRAVGDRESARKVADAFVASLKDPDALVRIESARGLINLTFGGSVSRKGGARKETAAAGAPIDVHKLADIVLGVLDDPDTEVRTEALRALAALAPLLAGNPPEVLKSAMQDPSSTIRANAVITAVHYKQGLDPITPVLTKLLLHDEDPQVRQTCANAVPQIQPSALSAAAVPALLEALQSEDANVRFQIVTLLTRLGPEARRAALPAFIASLKEPASTDRVGRGRPAPVTGPVYVAAEALGKTAPGTSSAKASIAALIDVLGAGHLHRAAAASRALAQFGKDAEPAVPALTKVFRQNASAKDPYDDVAALADALGKIAKETSSSAEAASALADALGAESERTREAAIKALANLGPKDAAKAIPRIRELEKNDPTKSVRSAAASFLGTSNSGN
jgi:HEAT repeat protein